MNTSDRIAAAIKSILDEDRRADRERIAELERDLSHMQLRVDLALSEDNEIHKQLDELTEKCAALVVERYEIARDHRHMREQVTAQMAAIERDISPTLDDAIVQFATRK